MPKKKLLSDEEVMAILQRGLKSGVKFSDTRLSRERQRVLDYYNGRLPAPVHNGNSKFVSTDVYDSVESMKATLVEAFSAGNDIVQFVADGPDDVALAGQATAYTKHVVFEDNGGTELFSAVIHDGLMARIGVVKVYWDKCIDEVEETFDDLTEDAVAMLLMDDEVTLTELSVDEDEPDLASGTITRKIDNSGVKIKILPPEEFIVDPAIRCIEDALELSHRAEKTRSELLSEGYPKDKVNLLSNDRSLLGFDQERITRTDAFASDMFGRNADSAQRATDVFEVFETYALIAMDASDTAKMWRIVHCGSTVLEKEEVDRHPFKTFVPLATPHAFYGQNFAARVIPTQNSRTILIRSILDHAVVATNPRFGVVKGALTNPRELLDNRIGGLVNVTRPDGIFALPQAPLNPFVFQTIAMLNDNKEDVTGVSRLSQGLNKDAVSSQNSQGMVEQLIGASMQRQKSIARSFAVQFLGPLFMEVYRLCTENETKQRIIEISGDFIPCTPSEWRKERKVSIDLRLGYGERDQLAKEYLDMAAFLAQDPAIGYLYGPEQRYAVYKKVLEIKGHKDVGSFLKDPAQTQPPPPDPMASAELELRQQELKLNERKQALSEKKIEQSQEIEKMRADMDSRLRTLEYMLKAHDMDRKQEETDNRIAVAQAEIKLAEEAEAKAPDANVKATAIISPNG